MQRHEKHHWRKGFDRALLGLSRDRRRRVGKHAAAYEQGYRSGRAVVLHGFMQKLAERM